MQPRVYTDYTQFSLACQLWEKECQLWDQNEAQRIAALKKEMGSGFGCFCLLVLIGVAWYVGAHYSAGAGWGAFFAGWIPFGLLMGLAEKIEMWRHRKKLEPVPFWQPKPVYIQAPPNQDPPPRRESPPPRQESPKPPAPDSGKVTTLRQAIEILGVPPKTTRSECQKAYRTLIAQYHPDKVAHLAPEFRKMAAEKSLQLNLAMRYIEQHRR
jgi:DnaJ-domain-containing protein 1